MYVVSISSVKVKFHQDYEKKNLKCQMRQKYKLDFEFPHSEIPSSGNFLCKKSNKKKSVLRVSGLILELRIFQG